MEDTLSIRLATTKDMEAVMHVALMACKDNGFLDYDPALIAKEIWPALNLDRGMFAVIGPQNGEMQGFVWLKIGTLFYSNRQCVEERCLWVHPEHRSARGGRARKLLEFTKKTADMLVLPLIIGIMSTKRQAGKVRLYERMFGDPAGAFFLYGATCGEVAELATDE